MARQQLNLRWPLLVLTGLVTACAQMPGDEQREFLESLGLDEPASHRFIRSAYALIDLISMLTAGPDECRAWAIPRGIAA